jgi:hypothetical protein
MCRTSTPVTTTDSGKLPNAHSMIAPIARPSMAGGICCWATVRKMVLPSPLNSPMTSSAAAAPASPPRYGTRHIAADERPNAVAANTAGVRSRPLRAAASVPITARDRRR